MKLNKGKRAPFDGILVTPAYLATTVVNLQYKIAVLDEKLRAAKEASESKLKVADKVTSVRVAAEAKKSAACLADMIRREGLYVEALKRCQNRSWFQSPTLWAVIGAAVGGGVCGLGVGVGK